MRAPYLPMVREKPGWGTQWGPVATEEAAFPEPGRWLYLWGTGSTEWTLTAQPLQEDYCPPHKAGALPLMSFFKPYRSASRKAGCDTVTGKNKTWLHVGSVSFTLTFSTHCFCSLQGHCLYIMACLREPCTSAWNVKPKCLLFRETSWPCTPVNAYRK